LRPWSVKVGIVLSLEVSRLARNNADWHRMLEICALTDTLIADEDGLYDPNHFNDRLVLGLRGTMSEAELHFLRARLEGGKLNKARRGELRMMLPPGLVYDAAGRVVLDPDRQVQQATRLIFETFERVGSAWGVVQTLSRQQAKLPVTIRTGPSAGALAWVDPTLNRVLRTLRNPRYAGAYVYGRTRQKRGTVTKLLPPDEWKVLIPDAHPGYITWERYQANLAVLEANSLPSRKNGHPTPAREGWALLQGLVVCGRCGRRMTVFYSHRRHPHYVCRQASKERGGNACQIISGATIDPAIGQLVVEAMTPATIQVAMEVFDELRQRHDQVDALHRSRIERARHEAELAQRQFLLANPENRLVADALEQRWNDKLRDLTAAEGSYAVWKEQKVAPLDPGMRDRVFDLTRDFPAVWNHPKTSPRDRKRMLRLLIEDVTLSRDDDIRLQIRWKGGTHTELHVPSPKNAADLRRTPQNVLDAIAELSQHHTDEQTACILNQQGLTSGTGLTFTRHIVRNMRVIKKIPGYRDHLKEAGMLTSAEVMDRFGITELGLTRLRETGTMRAVRCNRKDYLYEPPDEELIRRLKRESTGRAGLCPPANRNRVEEVQYEA
jgi:DNA invertase Pin-like site-specific DNA recombinase